MLVAAALQQTMAAPTSPLRLAIFGDSIAYGQGAADPSDTVGPRLVGALMRAGKPAVVRVFAVARARSSDLAAQLRVASDWQPQLAVIIVGANDLTHFVPPDRAAATLAESVRRLRARGCAVVVMPAPDMSVLSWVPSNLRGLVKSVSQDLRTQQVRAASAAGARIADIDQAAAARFSADSSLFSADRYHPSSAGYAVIAASLEPPVTAAADELLHT